MKINYGKLPEGAKPLIDCLEIVQKVGYDKNACLSHLDKEIEETDNLLMENRYEQDAIIDPLLDYKNRLQNAKQSFISFFE